MMRRFLKIALMALLLAAGTACTKEENKTSQYLDVTSNNIAGTWTLSEWNGEPLADGLFMYIELIRRDRKFAFYENMTGTSNVTTKKTGYFDLFDEDVITFLYDNSQTQYGKRYIISELTADRMVWTMEDNPDEVSVYIRCTAIPEEVK